MPNVVQYTEKLQKLKNTAISYFNDSPREVQIDLFLDEFKTMQEANALGFLTGGAKRAYDDLVATLKAPQNETPIHKYIKKRAMDAFVKMAGDLNSESISDACYYSELFETFSNEDKLREERTQYEQKRWAEDQYNNEIRNAFKTNDQDAMGKALADREKEGFGEIRNRLKQDGYEQGSIFKSCLKILEYSEENAKKENKTEQEQHKLEQIEQLKNSNLFIPYMKVVNDINKDKEKILYNDDGVQEAMNRSKQAAENEKRVSDFVARRDEHVAGIMDKFKQFDTIMNRINNELYSGKKTDKFKEMYAQMTQFDAGKWNDERYKKNCLGSENIDRYNTQIENLLQSVDQYITHKQRQFFPGRLGKARLNAAKEMKELLTSIQTSMREFKTYSDAHTQERGVLQEKEKVVTNAVAAKEEKKVVANEVDGPDKLFKKEKSAVGQVKRHRSNSVRVKSPKINEAFINAEKTKMSEMAKLTIEQKLAPYTKYMNILTDEKFRNETIERLRKAIENKEKKTREKISFAELRSEMKLPENKDGKNKRHKTMEDIQSNRKLKLESPVMKK